MSNPLAIFEDLRDTYFRYLDSPFDQERWAATGRHDEHALLTVIAEDLPPTFLDSEDQILAYLARNSKCGAPHAKQHVSLVTEREAEKTG